MDKDTALDILIDCESQLLAIADRHDELLHGLCHQFAIALKEVSGYPVGAFLEPGFSATSRPCHCLVHAFVKVDGLYVDIRGPHKTAAGLLEVMPVDGPTWEEALSLRKLRKLGEGNPNRTEDLVEKLAALRPIAAEVWKLTQKMMEALRLQIEAVH